MQLFCFLLQRDPHRNSASLSSSASNTTWPGVWGREQTLLMCWSSGQDGRAARKQLECSPAQHLKTKALRCTASDFPALKSPSVSAQPCQITAAAATLLSLIFHWGLFLSPSSLPCSSPPIAFGKCHALFLFFQTRGERGQDGKRKKGHSCLQIARGQIYQRNSSEK